MLNVWPSILNLKRVKKETVNLVLFVCVLILFSLGPKMCSQTAASETGEGQLEGPTGPLKLAESVGRS